MRATLKQCVGMDCSKDELVAGYGVLTGQLQAQVKTRRTFRNSTAGIKQLTSWANKWMDPQCECVFVVEATGVYHQKVAYQLYEAGYKICVILPNKSAHFRKTLTVRTVTDQTDCRALTLMGLEKQLDLWRPPHRLFSQLKQLTRERKRLKDEVTRLKNQRHAMDVATETQDATCRRIDERLALCERHINEIEKAIRRVATADQELERRFECACSIRGVGLITAATVVGEADGFNLVRNVRQLVCYAGYDVIEKKSGSSVRGKPKISKQGNSYIRRALYFPALTAVKTSSALSAFYDRLHERHNIPMKAYTAVQRKLLVLIYTMWTKQEYYKPEVHKQKMEQPESAAPFELA